MNQYDKMTKTSIPKLISILCVPTIISMLITSIYNMVDTIFVTEISDSASAAVTVILSLQTLIQTIGFTLGMGCGSMISRCLGKKDDKKASIYLSSNLFLGLILGILFLIFGLIFNNQIVLLLGASETSKDLASNYAIYIFLASPFMIMSFIMNNSIRSEGKAPLSMIGISSGAILNIFLDPLFINVFNMGIGGAGLATMISQIVSFIILLSFYLFNLTSSKISINSISKNPMIYLDAFKCGSPTLFRQGFSTIANIAFNFLAKPYGDSVVAAIGICAKLYNLIRSMVIGVGQGYQPVLGYNYGAKKYKRIRQAFFFTMAIQTGICLVAMILTLIIPSQLISLFRGSEEIQKVGQVAVRFMAIGLPLLGFSTIVNQSLQVTGYSFSASFLASCRQGIIYIPLIFLLEYLFGINGIALTQPISDIITALITIPFCFYFFNILKKKENELEENKIIENTAI